MQVLIIGGTGAISTGITRQLSKTRHDVTIFNRGQSKSQIPEDVRIIKGDRTEFNSFESRMQETIGFDCVIDMVCYTPEEAKSAVRAFSGDIDQFIFCSTIDVYSRPVARMPISEGATRTPPVSDYGNLKAASEDVLMKAHNHGDFATTIIRPWDTYGEGSSLCHTFGRESEYVDRIQKGKPIIVHGDGTGVWGSCHRDDVARAFTNAVGNETTYGESYHVTSEECMTWNRYHHEVAAALAAPKPKLIHIPTRVLLSTLPDRTDMLKDHFQYSTVFDNSKAKRDLGFEQRIPWTEGVQRTVQWLDKHNQIANSDNDPEYEQLIDDWQDITNS